MDANEQLEKYVDFIDLKYKTKINKAIRSDQNFIIIDFKDLVKFNTDVAEFLLEQPEDSIKAIEIAIKEIKPDIPKNFRVRISELPEGQKIMIKDIRSKHINKFLYIEGIVRQKSDVRPQVTSAKFECPSCGQTINVLQLDSNFKEPSRCSCGRKGKFRLLNKELVDAQGIVLEEAPEDLEGGAQPKRMNVLLKDDLVSPLSEKKTNPGSKIKINGILKEVPIMSKTGGKSTRFDLMIESNFMDSCSEDIYDIKITKEEEKIIKNIGKDTKSYKKLIESIAPSIYGYEKAKEAILLQLVGGSRKERTDGVTTRGDIHILLIGDPGAGKSQLLKRSNVIAPKSRYVSGKGVSGAGLTASVVKDEFLKGWSLEAGALVLASNGVCCIDEMDKMGEEDRAAMHEALEQQTVSISKANIQATLISRTTVLAAANPKFGRFDPYDTIAKQIDLPPSLINRFDLIFAIKDLPDKKKDDLLAGHILSLHQNPEIEEPEIETKVLRKYIAYARQNINPVLTDGAIEEIRNYYLDMRSGGSDEGGFKSVPISPRQLEALVRLSEAAAKSRLSNKVTRRDAKKGIELVHYCLSQLGVDPETGKIDIDRITTGITSSERNKISVIKEIFEEMESQIGKTIPLEDVVKQAGEKGIKDYEVEEVIEKLKRSGDLFEPKHGFLQRI